MTQTFVSLDSRADKVVFESESMSAPKRKGGAEKLSEKNKRYLEEGASKCLKISNLFGKPPIADSDTMVSCSVWPM